VQSVVLILTIGPAGRAPESSSGWVVSAAGPGWSSRVDISAARQGNTHRVINLKQPTASFNPQTYAYNVRRAGATANHSDTRAHSPCLGVAQEKKEIPPTGEV